MTHQPKPFAHPAAWDTRDCPSKEPFVVQLERAHLDALARALDVARSRGRDAQSIAREDFPLPDIERDVSRWRDQVRDGRGLIVLRGFPVDRMSVDDVGLMYLGLGLHFGNPVSQSNMGERLGHVINIGGQDARERAYRNARELNLHTDRCDHVAMLCIRPAVSGGVSGYASALTIHNRILAERPELLAPLYAGYHLHRFGEQPAGEPPITRVPIPVFSIADGVPNVIYIRGYIDIAEKEGHTVLSSLQSEALDYFDEVANRPDVRLNFTLEAGEASFFNNCLLLHTRTAFEDPNRHLMRLWLMEPDRPAVAGVRAHKGPGGIAPIAGKGTYYADRPAT